MSLFISFERWRLPQSKNREIDLDFIRGLAILLVLDFHVPRGLLTAPLQWIGFTHLGWVGVNIFFVLSGFLVGGLLIKEWKRDGSIRAGRFLLRRAMKIWPQYYVYLAAILITGHRSWNAVKGNFVHLQNYVGGVPHTWTLAVEEHAYLLLVLLLVVAAWGRVKPKSLFIFLFAATLSESALRLVLAHYGHSVFFMTHTSLDGILDGVLLALVFHFARRRFDRMSRNPWVTFGLLSAGLALVRLIPASPVSDALRIDGANLLAIAALLLLYRPGARRCAAYRWVAFIGIYSYGIYLWHVAILAPLTHLYSKAPAEIGFSFAIVYMTLAIVLGAFTTEIIEFPMLRLRDRILPNRPVLVRTTVDGLVVAPAETGPPAAKLAPAAGIEAEQAALYRGYQELPSRR